MKRLSSLVLLASLSLTCPLRAADITWASFIADPAGADAGFVDLLQADGHTVNRYFVENNQAPTPDDIVSLNSADLIIISRAVNSGSFDNDRGQVWNEQITTPIIAMSGYITRSSRMGWAAGTSVPDSGPTPLVAVNPSHPIFNGINFAADGVTTTNNYNVMIDRGTTTIANALTGGTVIATNPSITDGIAIAEWLAGTGVTDDGVGNQTLAGNRYFFAGGSREASGNAVATAGVLDLTNDGQRMFLNTVNYALGIPEPSTLLLAFLGFLLLPIWMIRKR